MCDRIRCKMREIRDKSCIFRVTVYLLDKFTTISAWIFNVQLSIYHLVIRQVYESREAQEVMPGSPRGARGGAGGRSFVSGYSFNRRVYVGDIWEYLLTEELVFIGEYAIQVDVQTSMHS